VYPRYHVCLAVRHLEKFGEVDPPGPKVIGVYILNVGQVFEFIILKNCWGTPIPGKCALASFGHSVAHVKI